MSANLLHNTYAHTPLAEAVAAAAAALIWVWLRKAKKYWQIWRCPPGWSLPQMLRDICICLSFYCSLCPWLHFYANKNSIFSPSTCLLLGWRGHMDAICSYSSTLRPWSLIILASMSLTRKKLPRATGTNASTGKNVKFYCPWALLIRKPKGLKFPPHWQAHIQSRNVYLLYLQFFLWSQSMMNISYPSTNYINTSSST